MRTTPTPKNLQKRGRETPQKIERASEQILNSFLDITGAISRRGIGYITGVWTIKYTVM